MKRQPFFARKLSTAVRGANKPLLSNILASGQVIQVQVRIHKCIVNSMYVDDVYILYISM